MLTLWCIFICICYIHQNNSSFIGNGKDIILEGWEVHIKIIHAASLSSVGEEVPWGCQCQQQWLCLCWCPWFSLPG